MVPCRDVRDLGRRSLALLARGGRSPRPARGTYVAAWGSIGFGACHVVVAVGMPWVQALHRIRMAAQNLLPWDLGWLAVFGFVPLAIGLRFRAEGAGPGEGGGRGLAAVLTAGLAAMRPPPGRAHTTVAFVPRVAERDASHEVTAAGGGLVRSDGANVFVVADLPAAGALPSTAKRTLCRRR